jgi:hypothetical protein
MTHGQRADQFWGEKKKFFVLLKWNEKKMWKAGVVPGRAVDNLS